MVELAPCPSLFLRRYNACTGSRLPTGFIRHWQGGISRARRLVAEQRLVQAGQFGLNETAVFLYERVAEPDRRIEHDAICLLSVAKRILPVQGLLLAALLRVLHVAVAMTDKSFHPKTW